MQPVAPIITNPEVAFNGLGDLPEMIVVRLSAAMKTLRIREEDGSNIFNVGYRRIWLDCATEEYVRKQF